MNAVNEAVKFKRPKFSTRIFRLVRKDVAELAINLLRSLPIDSQRPLEIIVREEVKRRSIDQNSALWSGPLKDIAEQVWVEGRQFDAEVWMHHFKASFLPDESAMTREELAEVVKDPDTYRKWDYTPDGERMLRGSSTHLTVHGFSLFMREIEAFGAGKGVEFSVSPTQARAWG